MTYALGRGLEHYDQPAVRAIVRDAARGRLPVLVADPRRRAEHAVPDAACGGRSDRALWVPAREWLMFVTKKALPRRTFLRGAGTVLGLAAARCDGAGADRAGADAGAGRSSVSASSTCRTAWRATSPASTTGRRPVQGTAFRAVADPDAAGALSRSAAVVSGLAQHQADAQDDGANGDHTRGTSTWLTGAHPKRTEGADVAQRHLGRPDRGGGARQGDGAAVARARRSTSTSSPGSARTATAAST